MRVLLMAKGEPSGAPTPPSAKMLEDWGRYQADLTKAGVVLAEGRLRPSEQGKRVRFDGAKRTVIDGPFSEAKELVGGFWLWQVRSMDEAVEWLKRAPFDGTEIEIRQIAEPEGPTP